MVNKRKRIARREDSVWPDPVDTEEEEEDATSLRRRRQPLQR
jgi:hypothetical protein